MQFGNLDKFPGIHEFGPCRASTSRNAGSATSPSASAAPRGRPPRTPRPPRQLVDWVKRATSPKASTAQGYDPPWQAFAKGQGVFLIGGTWLIADLEKAMGKNLGFMLPPGATPDAPPVATGGTGLPFAITAKSPNPDAAAAYIDFITNADAMKVLTTDRQPAGRRHRPAERPAGAQQDVFKAFGTATKNDGLVPYLDYATPTFADTLGAALQDLLARRRPRRSSWPRWRTTTGLRG